MTAPMPKTMSSNVSAVPVKSRWAKTSSGSIGWAERASHTTKPTAATTATAIVAGFHSRSMIT